MIKVGVIIENGQLRNVCSLENANVNEIALIIANLEIVKSQLVSKLTELTRSNALSKKSSDQASHGESLGSPQIQKPKCMINCSDKQYKVLRNAGFEDSDIKNMSRKEITKSIGAYFDSLKRDSI